MHGDRVRGLRVARTPTVGDALSLSSRRHRRRRSRAGPPSRLVRRLAGGARPQPVPALPTAPGGRTTGPTDDAHFVDVVTRLDTAVAAVDGRGFTVTPFRWTDRARRVGEGRDRQRRGLAQGSPPHGPRDLARGRRHREVAALGDRELWQRRPRRCGDRACRGAGRCPSSSRRGPTRACSRGCVISARSSMSARGNPRTRPGDPVRPSLSARRSPRARSRSRAKVPTTASPSTAVAPSPTSSPTPRSRSTRSWCRSGGGALASAVPRVCRRPSCSVASPVSRPCTSYSRRRTPRSSARGSERARCQKRRPGRVVAHRHDFMWPWEPPGASVATGILDDEAYDWASVVDALLRTGGTAIAVGEPMTSSRRTSSPGRRPGSTSTPRAPPVSPVSSRSATTAPSPATPRPPYCSPDDLEFHHSHDRPRRPLVRRGPALARRPPLVLRLPHPSSAGDGRGRQRRDDRRSPEPSVRVGMAARRSPARRVDAGPAPHAARPWRPRRARRSEWCRDLRLQRHGRRRRGARPTSATSGSTSPTAQSPKPAALALVTPDGAVSVAADDLMFPNGTVITPDGSTLIVGETVRPSPHRVRRRRGRHAVESSSVGGSRSRHAGRHLPRRSRRHLGRRSPRITSVCGSSKGGEVTRHASRPSGRASPACWAAPTAARSTSSPATWRATRRRCSASDPVASSPSAWRSPAPVGREHLRCRDGDRRGVMLGIDIGGTGIKGAPVDVEKGELTTDRFRLLTPKPATPEAVAKTVAEIVGHFGYRRPGRVHLPRRCEARCDPHCGQCRQVVDRH